MTSQEAIIDFQRTAKKQRVYSGAIDGDPGVLTLSALESLLGKDGVPPWMLWASKEMGVSEVSGKKDNPRIVFYHSFTSLGKMPDEVPWCASFICAALESTGFKSTDSAAAASYDKYGRKATLHDYGAICTVRRNGGSGRHVFFNAGNWKGYVFGLGGNQGNKVNIQMYDARSIIETRLPN